MTTTSPTSSWPELTALFVPAEPVPTRRSVASAPIPLHEVASHAVPGRGLVYQGNVRTLWRLPVATQGLAGSQPVQAVPATFATPGPLPPCPIVRGTGNLTTGGWPV